MTEKIRIRNLSAPAASATETLLSTIADVNGCVTLPIDVEVIIEKMGIKVEQLDLDSSTSGLLVKDKANEPFKAVSNISNHPHRRRFTFAHELGHYIHSYQNLPDDQVAGKVEKRDELSSLGRDPEEIWANQFAASLLMPASIVRSYWADGRSFSWMILMFDVSSEAMSNRLSTLGLIRYSTASVI
jgi:Zn-dependent peptidase ImmA (M78 family)